MRAANRNRNYHELEDKLTPAICLGTLSCRVLQDVFQGIDFDLKRLEIKSMAPTRLYNCLM